MPIIPFHTPGHHKFVFSILAHTKTYKKTLRGLTTEEADRLAWKWLANGFSDTVGNKYVCIKPDDILTVEIKKAK